MPGRITIAVILAFFVGMTSWQWLRNYGNTVGEGPQLKPSLELAAEDGSTNWQIRYNGKRLGDALTQVSKSSMGVYILKQNVLLDGDLETFMGPIGSFAKLSGIKLNDFRAIIRTEMELTYLGTMRKLNLSFVARPKPVIVIPESPNAQPTTVTEKSKNERDDQQNLMKLSITAEASQVDQLNFKGMFSIASMQFPIDDVKIKHRSKDSFLSSISPTDCMAGLRLGMRWQTPMIDPTQMMMTAMATSKVKELGNGMIATDDLVKTKITEVQVLSELRELAWGGSKVACYVVQSAEKGSRLQIWVNASNYRVLKQTFESDRHQLELLREPKKED